MHLFGTIGTHSEGFDRLVISLDEFVSTSDHTATVQIGEGTYEPDHCEFFRFATYGTMHEHINKADVVVCHGGAGTLIDSITTGVPAVVLPRLQKYGEAADDHQIELASVLHEEDMVVLMDENDTISDGIERSRSIEFQSADIDEGPMLSREIKSDLYSM